MAVGSVAGLSAIAVILWSEVRRLRAQDARGTRSQAEAVTAWVAEHLGEEQWEVEVVNGSSQPVYDVVVSLSWPEGPSANHVLPVFIPGTRQRELMVLDSAEPISAFPELDMSFTDSGGTRWRRTHRGELEELRLRDTARAV